VSGARLVRQEGRRAIAVDDVVQSIEVRPGEVTPGYWPEMLPPRIGGRALLLGHGGGTVARLLLALSAEVEVLAVDDDEQLLTLASGDPRFRIDDPRLTLERGDAFALARRLEAEGRQFEHVAVDLYRGKEMERAMLARPFLRRINAMLTPDGTATFNLARDRRTARRLRRLGQHLQLVETRLVGLNCVVLCERLDR
jgi:spermidine synthase